MGKRWNGSRKLEETDIYSTLAEQQLNYSISSGLNNAFTETQQLELNQYPADNHCDYIQKIEVRRFQKWKYFLGCIYEHD